MCKDTLADILLDHRARELGTRSDADEVVEDQVYDVGVDAVDLADGVGVEADGTAILLKKLTAPILRNFRHLHVCRIPTSVVLLVFGRGWAKAEHPVFCECKHALDAIAALFEDVKDFDCAAEPPREQLVDLCVAAFARASDPMPGVEDAPL